MHRLLLLFITHSLSAQEVLSGQWALELPNHEVGWLSVEEAKVELMWGVGSARPVERFERQGGALTFDKTIRRPLAPKDEAAVKWQIKMTAAGRILRGLMQSESGAVVTFSGKRQPTMPPRPDLTKIVFSEPIVLFNGRDLTGWRVSNPAKKNGWSVREGIMCNDTPKTDFSAYGEYANLRTDAEFEDFQLHAEYRLPPETGGNSGIYLRGMYEGRSRIAKAKCRASMVPGRSLVASPRHVTRANRLASGMFSTSRWWTAMSLLCSMAPR